jgi:hypothetical protein
MNILLHRRSSSKRRRDDDEDDVMDEYAYDDIFSQKKTKYEESSSDYLYQSENLNYDTTWATTSTSMSSYYDKPAMQREVSPMIPIEKSSPYSMDGISGLNKLKSIIHEPKSVLHQANAYVEQMFGLQVPNSLIHQSYQPQKLSSRQAVIISRDRVDPYTQPNREDEPSSKAASQHQPPRQAQSREEIYVQSLRQRRQSKNPESDDEVSLDSNSSEEYPSLFNQHDSGSRSLYLFYELFWSILVLVVAFVIILLSCTQLLVLLPFLICYRLYSKLNELLESRILTSLIIVSSIYYAHKIYFLYYS